ncbi:MAG: hypothetical protein HPM95_12570 [Alphaproteobacteria bacterium]|nr:hypothetical protein [Alphaproteobacteria bacterium]
MAMPTRRRSRSPEPLSSGAAQGRPAGLDHPLFHAARRDRGGPGIVWAGALTLVLPYVVAMLVVRGRRLGRLTAGLKRDAAGLRDLNSRLVEEIDERRRVETELREAQAGLARASRLAAVGEMSAAVAHELNQPLAALGMFVSGARLYQARGEAEAVSENLDEIDALRLRMASLTQELKRLARPGESRIETVDMRECLKTSAKLVRPRIEETGVALRLHLPEQALRLYRAAPGRAGAGQPPAQRHRRLSCHARPACRGAGLGDGRHGPDRDRRQWRRYS